MKVRQYIKDMNQANSNYPHDVIITEIFVSNDWFPDICEPVEMIREEVERQFDKYVGKKEND